MLIVQEVAAMEVCDRNLELTPERQSAERKIKFVGDCATLPSTFHTCLWLSTLMLIGDDWMLL